MCLTSTQNAGKTESTDENLDPEFLATVGPARPPPPEQVAAQAAAAALAEEQRQGQRWEQYKKEQVSVAVWAGVAVHTVLWEGELGGSEGDVHGVSMC